MTIGVYYNKKTEKNLQDKTPPSKSPPQNPRQNLSGQNPFAKPPSEKLYCYQIHMTNYPG